MKKRLLATMLCLTMALAMTACGKNTSSSNKNETQGNQLDAAFPNFSVGLTDDGFIEGIKATDYIEMVDYEGIEVKKSKINITDKYYDLYLKELLDKYVKKEKVTDRPIKDDDYVNIDYVGKINDVKFEGGSATNYTVRIGVTQFIDDFIEQLIGHKIGETFDIEVTFPKEYPNSPDLAGKDAIFTIKINSIEEPVYPEITDDFVKKNFPEYKNAEEFKTETRKTFEFEQKMNYVWSYVVENSKVISYPEKYLEQYVALQLDYYKYMAEANGATFTSFLSAQKMTEEQFVKQLEEVAKIDIQSFLCVQAVCEAEGYTSTEADIQSYMGISDAAYLEYFYGIYGKGYLNQAILIQKAAAHAVAHSKLVD